MKRFWFACFCLMIAQPCAAAPPSIGEQMAHFLGFALHKNTPLADITKALGSAPVNDTSSGAIICYKTTDAYIQFISEKTKGPDHPLSGFAMSLKDPGRSCVELKKSLGQLGIGPLYLGMSRKEYLDILKRMGASPDPYSNMLETIPQFSHDALIGIQVLSTAHEQEH